MPISTLTDLRANFGPARDQGPRPTCLAFAASDAHAGARPGWTPLSVEWAYYHALQRDGGLPSDGVTMSAMRQTLRADGQPDDLVWPYLATEIADPSSWAPPSQSPVLFRRDSSDCPSTLEGIINSIEGNVPVLLVMSISISFFNGWDKDFVILGAEPPDPHLRHAVVVVGHGVRDGRQLVLIRNSWGHDWADKGYAWVDAEYLVPRLLLASVLTGEL